MQTQMTEHMGNKHLSRQLKDDEMSRAQEDSTINVLCFDPQQVLINSSIIRRKLATYNLSVFDLALKNGYCYMWHEGVAKRGANNISSCIWRYIKTNSTRKEFVFFSDNCGGQNKNRTIAAMYMHAVATLKVDIISDYYLERENTENTENEGDSMHSTIKKAARRTNIYTPMQWYTQSLVQPRDKGSFIYDHRTGDGVGRPQ